MNFIKIFLSSILLPNPFLSSFLPLCPVGAHRLPKITNSAYNFNFVDKFQLYIQFLSHQQKKINMIVIVGAGISGATLAYLYAELFNKKVVVLEKRDHIAGNCYDYADQDGLLINKYGPHFFHTNSEKVWNFVLRFTKMTPWEHRVLSWVDNKFVPVPVNITTVNELFGLQLKNQEQMNKWLAENTGKVENPKNSEESCINRVGETLYKKMFEPYTKKQWEIEPKDLDSSVLNRIPVRNNFDDRYFTDKHQGIPSLGYTEWVKNMLNHKNIQYHLNVDYFQVKNKYEGYEKLFFTGPIDSYFQKSGLEKLEYRTVTFEEQVLKVEGDYLFPAAQCNYPSLEYPYTRITEYKRILNQKQPKGKTKILKQFSTSKGDPYYPIPNKRNQDLYVQYKKLADKQVENRIYFVGRLATYKYFNMDQAIGAAIEVFEKLQAKDIKQQLKMEY